MTAPDSEAAVNQVLIEAGLRPHPFFTPSAAGHVSPRAGWEVARAWHDITKTFMLTTIASLGVLAAELAAEPAPAANRLTALQTGYRVIGDDLININPIFAKTAPDGPTGIHYLWWAETILGPVTAALPDPPPAPGSPPPPGVQALLDNMGRLARSPIGAAVQLRVVEDIALDIATAFRNLFRKVTVDSIGLFCDGDLGWMDAHIEAEVIHQASVSDHETGMTTIAVTPGEQRQFLAATTEYAARWASALDDFAAMPARS